MKLSRDTMHVDRQGDAAVAHQRNANLPDRIRILDRTRHPGLPHPRGTTMATCCGVQPGSQELHFDLLPAVNGGDSCRVACGAHATPRWVPASPATARIAPGLTLPPQAFLVSAGPAATRMPRMLRAALASRSWMTPHAWHAQERTLSGLGPSRCPHAEQVCEVGSQRPTLTTRRPCWAALSCNSRRNRPQPASWTLLASRVRARPLTLRFSTATAWFSRTSRRAS